MVHDGGISAVLNNKLTYKGYAVNGKIEIPRIDLEYPILEANADTIMVAVGFIYGPGLNEVGNNVIIGAGAVVTKSFPSNVLIAGNPAQIKKKLEVNSESINNNYR